jgi:hypothetical protein
VSGLSGTVDLPAVGPVDKKIIIPIAAAGVAFVGYRYWQARSTPADDSTVSDGEFGAIDSSVPDVLGAIKDGNLYGSDTGAEDTNTVDGYGFTGTTNAQWTQYAATQLSQSATWSYTDILTALGNFLAGQPLSTLQQQIVQSAIAVAGYPPVGTHVVVPGGNTALTLAPSGLHVIRRDSQSITIGYTPVAGAAGYRAYRGVGANVGSSTGSSIVVAGLKPATAYEINVAGYTASGGTGPHSKALHTSTLSAPKKK